MHPTRFPVDREDAPRPVGLRIKQLVLALALFSPSVVMDTGCVFLRHREFAGILSGF